MAHFLEPGDVPTSEELLGRVAAGDAAAFRTLFRREAPRLKAAAWRITGSEMLAEDALQDVFLRLWNGERRHDPGLMPARPWLLTLVRFQALDLARRAGRERPQDDLPDTADPTPDALSRLMLTTEGRALHACLSALDARAARLIRAAFLDGYTHATLSQRTGMPLGTVKGVIRRGLRALRECLER